MNEFTLSLSRWHKVAERLSRSYTESTRAAREAFCNTQVSGFLGSAQIERLKESAVRQMESMRQSFALQDALVRIRQAVGDANAAAGVSRELAEYDALSRRQKLIETILAAQSSEMVDFEEMPELPKQMMAEDRYDRSRGTIRVRMLDTASFEALRAEAEALRARVYAVADRISDLNRERLSLELPEEIARAAGL